MIVDYEFFLKRKDDKSITHVNITCEECGKQAIVTKKSLLSNCKKFEQICSNCLSKHKANPKHLQGTYYGIKFESSYELGFIHHCMKNNLAIARCDDKIAYVLDGETKLYNPDFVVNDKIIEIKGLERKGTREKAEAAIKFYNSNYKLYRKEDLKRLSNFILPNKIEALAYFNQDKLHISQYPTSWNISIVSKKEDSIGFAYLTKDLLQNKIFIDYSLDLNFSYQDRYFEKTSIIGFANAELELIRMCNRTKSDNSITFSRTLTYSKQHEEELTKAWYESTFGGKNNAMYGKRDSNAINGKTVSVYKNSKLIYTFKTNGEACEKLNMTQYQLKKCLKDNETYDGMIFKKTSRNYTKESFQKRCVKCYAFDLSGNLIKVFESKSDLRKFLKEKGVSLRSALVKHNIIDNVIYAEQDTFNPDWLNQEVYHAYKIYAYKDDKLKITFNTIFETAEHFNTDSKTLKKLINLNLPINGYTLSYNEVANKRRQSIASKHKPKTKQYAYNYKLDLTDAFGNFIRKFNTINECSAYFNLPRKTITSCIKNHELINGMFINYDEEGKANMKALSEKRACVAKRVKHVEQNPRNIYYAEDAFTHEVHTFYKLADFSKFLNLSQFMITKHYLNKDAIFNNYKLTSQSNSKKVLKINSSNQIVSIFANISDAAVSLNLSKNAIRKLIENDIEINNFRYIHEKDYKGSEV